MTFDSLPFSAPADRNRAPILAVLETLLPQRCSVLEVASGTGQHAEHYASKHPQWRWQPSDADAELLPAIAARCAGLPNVARPVHLDVLQQPWPAELDHAYDAAYNANMLHISPWATCAALMHGLATRVVEGGALVLYGPFVVDDEPTVPSNAAFDASLRLRNVEWGLRRFTDVAAAAHAAGFDLERRVAMPANNLLIVLRRGP